MTVFRTYTTTLAFVLGLSNFTVFALAAGNGHALISRDFLVPGAILFFLVSLVFLALKLVRLHDSRIATQALSQRSAQIANFKAALRNQSQGQPEFSRGIKSWNS
jgi:hypothetical protein